MAKRRPPCYTLSDPCVKILSKIKDKEIKMDKDTMLDLIHSELNAQYNDNTLADYALLGTLKSLVTHDALIGYINRNGWNK